MTNEYIDNMALSRDAQSARRDQLQEQRDHFLRGKKSSSGKWYYCVHRKSSNKHKYLGDDSNEDVRKIKELRFLDVYLQRTSNNIKLLRDTINQLQKTDYDSINDILPKSYRDPQMRSPAANSKSARWKEHAELTKARYDIYRPEDLKIRVNDGNMVRSKSEAMIYNYLLSVGATFVYELPLVIDGRTIVPDFTLLSDIDSKTEIIIEHQGLMSDEYYRNRFADKVFRYLRSGFVPGINIFFTFDGIDGSFDIRPIAALIKDNVK